MLKTVFSQKKRKMHRRCTQKKKEEKKMRQRSGGLCGNLQIFIIKMGLLKSKGGEKGEEGKGGSVMDAVPQLPSFSLYLSFL